MSAKSSASESEVWYTADSHNTLETSSPIYSCRRVPAAHISPGSRVHLSPGSPTPAPRRHFVKSRRRQRIIVESESSESDTDTPVPPPLPPPPRQPVALVIISSEDEAPASGLATTTVGGVASPHKTQAIRPSPRKYGRPRPRKLPTIPLPTKPLMLKVTAPMVSPGPTSDKLDVAIARAERQFKKYRQELAQLWYKQFNMHVFRSQLPADLGITWSATLNKTAGRAYTGWKIKGVERRCRVELATKVVNSLDRLKGTLLHELCHCAAWMLDYVEEGHGPHFKQWAQRAMNVYPDIPVTTRHTYEIDYKYKYVCSNRQCSTVVGRHSKSIDTSRMVCGRCKSKLVLTDRKGNSLEGKPLNRYQLFVKEHYPTTKRLHPTLKHAAVMKLVAEQYKVHTAASPGSMDALSAQLADTRLN
ncbi:hypothetical protein H4R34_000960 [Dimargaris verticillata]|uniref:SprT-like domain-containing protein n=1 Tax=Dimargaris verticillata TaxID=2761393 RepID=A0A9W8BAS5_9FUNG|nr:hypothetical protein H4R34_000960 [Dimargaris verticillata]